MTRSDVSLNGTRDFSSGALPRNRSPHQPEHRAGKNIDIGLGVRIEAKVREEGAPKPAEDRSEG